MDSIKTLERAEPERDAVAVESKETGLVIVKPQPDDLMRQHRERAARIMHLWKRA